MDEEKNKLCDRCEEADAVIHVSMVTETIESHKGYCIECYNMMCAHFVVQDKIPEYIICAAMHFEDRIPHPNQPLNIKTGYVIGGWRHHNCLGTAATFRKVKEVTYENYTYGFLSSTGKFYNRVEALKIAQAAGQVGKMTKVKGELDSYDLY